VFIFIVSENRVVVTEWLSSNILTEYFKHAAHSPFFSLQDAVYFVKLPFFGSCNI
jgi:hypothetical protein